IKAEFHDAKTGTTLRAFQSFDQPTTFAKQLRIHLTNLLESMFGQVLDRPVWDIETQGPPFRGLDVFEVEHSPVFFGREDEIVAIRNRLREQACRGCAFLLISGASGTGKSSLARAGVLPDICHHEVDDGILKWRRMIVKPNQLSENLLSGLVKSLMEQDVLPELASWADDISVPADASQIPGWMTRLVLRVKDALHACDSQRGGTRLVILIDQLEELFSSTSLSLEAIEQFFQCVDALARSGKVWVLATVRSDFSHECQQVPTLVRMKNALAYDLIAPAPDALLRVVTGPAQLAGLKFEKSGEHSLADTILRESAGRTELLPLVEYLLLDLFEHRTSEGVLTYARFRELGGVEGALRQRCEATFESLPKEVQARLPAVLSRLLTLSGDNLNTAVRRTVPLERFKQEPAERQLVEAMVRERLFTTSSDPDGTQVVSVTHEAVLRVWPRVTEWTDQNRAWLRIRSRVEQSLTRWKHEPDNSLLLAQGVPLSEASQLLDDAPHLLDTETKSYIERSQAYHTVQVRRRQRIVLASVVGLLIVASMALVYRSNLQVLRGEAKLAAAENKSLAREAAQQKLFGQLNAIRERAFRRPVGWSWENQAELASLKLDGLALNEDMRRVLREEYARVAMANDLRKTGSVFKGLRVSTLAWSADGKWLALGERTATNVHLHIQIVDAETYQPIQQLAFFQSIGNVVTNKETDGVTALLFSPSGKELYAGTRAGEILCIATDGFTLKHRWPAHAKRVFELVLSPDNQSLVSSGVDGVIKWWKTDDLKCTREEPGHGNVDSMFSRDGKLYVSSSKLVEYAFDNSTTRDVVSNCSQIYPAAGSGWFVRDENGLTHVGLSGEPIRKLNCNRNDPSTFSLTGSQDGSWSVVRTKISVEVWDFAIGEQFAILNGVEFFAVAFDPNRPRLLVADEEHVDCYELRRDPVWRNLPLHPARIIKTLATADDLYTVGVYAPPEQVEVRSWSLPSPQEIASFQIGSADALSLVLSQQGDRLAYFEPQQGLICEFDCQAKSIRPLAVAAMADCNQIAYSGNGQMLVLDSLPRHEKRFLPNRLLPWSLIGFDRNSNQQSSLWTNEMSALMKGQSYFSSLVVGETFLAASFGDAIVQCDLKASADVRLWSMKGEIASKLCLLNERRLVAGFESGEVRLLESTDGRTLASIKTHAARITALASVGNLVVSGDELGEVSIFELDKDRLILQCRLGPCRHAIDTLSLLKAGEFLAIQVRNEPTVHILNLQQLRANWNSIKL
ncbi:MAG: AAA family ATPase, partial [Pirellulaceae bacterium]|nr:AAA family ATPase [Pirellulaceae bacterium]